MTASMTPENIVARAQTLGMTSIRVVIQMLQRVKNVLIEEDKRLLKVWSDRQMNTDFISQFNEQHQPERD